MVGVAREEREQVVAELADGAVTNLGRGVREAVETDADALAASLDESVRVEDDEIARS